MSSSEVPLRRGKSPRPPAWTSVVLGLLALAALPAGTLLVRRFVSVDLVRATLGAVVAAFLLGLAGVSASRRARYRIERSLQRRGERAARLGRVLVFLGLYVAAIGGIALGFYAVVLAFS